MAMTTCMAVTMTVTMSLTILTCDCGSGSAPAWRSRRTMSLNPDTCTRGPEHCENSNNSFMALIYNYRTMFENNLHMSSLKF